MIKKFIFKKERISSFLALFLSISLIFNSTVLVYPQEAHTSDNNIEPTPLIEEEAPDEEVEIKEPIVEDPIIEDEEEIESDLFFIEEIIADTEDVEEERIAPQKQKVLHVEQDGPTGDQGEVEFRTTFIINAGNGMVVSQDGLVTDSSVGIGGNAVGIKLVNLGFNTPSTSHTPNQEVGRLRFQFKKDNGLISISESRRIEGGVSFDVVFKEGAKFRVLSSKVSKTYLKSIEGVEFSEYNDLNTFFIETVEEFSNISTALTLTSDLFNIPKQPTNSNARYLVENNLTYVFEGLSSITSTVQAPSTGKLHCFASSGGGLGKTLYSRNVVRPPVTKVPCSLDFSNDRTLIDLNASNFSVFAENSYINGCPGGGTNIDFFDAEQAGEGLPTAGDTRTRFSIDSRITDTIEDLPNLLRPRDGSNSIVGCRYPGFNSGGTALNAADEQTLSNRFFLNGLQSASTDDGNTPSFVFPTYTESFNNPLPTKIIATDDDGDSLNVAYNVVNNSDSCPGDDPTNNGSNITSRPTGYTAVELDEENSFSHTVNEADKKICVWASDKNRAVISSIRIPLDFTPPKVNAGEVPVYVGALRYDHFIHADEIDSTDPIVSFPPSSYSDNFEDETYDNNGTPTNYSEVTLKYIVTGFAADCRNLLFKSGFTTTPTRAVDIPNNRSGQKICIELKDTAGNRSLIGTTSPFSRDARSTPDRTPPATTADINLKASSDLGISSSDKITKDSTPVFIVSSIPANIQTLIVLKDSDNVELIRNVLVRSQGNPITEEFFFVNDDGSEYELADGIYSIDITSVGDDGNTLEETKLTDIVIDTQSPVEGDVPSFHPTITTTTLEGVTTGVAGPNFFVASRGGNNAPILNDGNTPVLIEGTYSDDSGTATLSYSFSPSAGDQVCLSEDETYTAHSDTILSYLVDIPDEEYVVCRKYTDTAGNETIEFDRESKLILQKDSNHPTIESITVRRTSPSSDAINDKYAKAGDTVEIAITFNELNITPVTLTKGIFLRINNPAGPANFVTGTILSETPSLSNPQKIIRISFVIPAQFNRIDFTKKILISTTLVGISDILGNISSDPFAVESGDPPFQVLGVETQETDPDASDFFYISIPYIAVDGVTELYRTIPLVEDVTFALAASSIPVNSSNGVINTATPEFSVSGIPGGIEGVRMVVYAKTTSGGVTTSTQTKILEAGFNGDFSFDNPFGEDSYTISVDLIDNAGNKVENFFGENALEIIVDANAPEETLIPTLINTAASTSGFTPGYINASEIDTTSEEAIIQEGEYSSDSTVEYALGLSSTTDRCDLGIGATARNFMPIEELHLGYVSGLDDGSYRLCRKYTDAAGNVTEIFGGVAKELKIIKDTDFPELTIENQSSEDISTQRDYIVSIDEEGTIKVVKDYQNVCDASQTFIEDVVSGSTVTVAARTGDCFEATDTAGNAVYRATNVNTAPTIAFEGFDSATNELQSGTVTVTDVQNDILTAGYSKVTELGGSCPASSGTISTTIPSEYTQVTIGTNGEFTVSDLSNGDKLCIWTSDSKIGVISSVDISGIDVEVPTISTLPEYINTPENTPLSDGIINASEKDLTTPLISFPTDSYTDNNPNNITVRYLVTAGDAVCSEQTYPDVSSESIPTPASITDDADSLKVCVRVRDEAGNFAYTEPTGTFSRDATAPEELTVPTLINQAIPTSGTTPGYINASEVNTSSTEPIITVGTFSDDSTAEYVLALGDQCGTDYLSIDDIHLGYASGLTDGEYRLCRRYTDTAGNVTEVSDGTLSDGTTSRELKIIKDVDFPTIDITPPVEPRTEDRTYNVSSTDNNDRNIELANGHVGPCDVAQSFSENVQGGAVEVLANKKACLRTQDDAGNVVYTPTDPNIIPTILFNGFDTPTTGRQSGTVTVLDTEGDPLTVGYTQVNVGDACPASSGTISLTRPIEYDEATLNINGAFTLTGLEANKQICVWATDKIESVISSVDISGIDTEAPVINTPPIFINALARDTELNNIRVINAAKVDANPDDLIISFPQTSYQDNASDKNNLIIKYLVTNKLCDDSDLDYDGASEDIPTVASITEVGDDLRVCVRVEDEVGNNAYKGTTETFTRDVNIPEEITVPTLVNKAAPSSGTVLGYINLSEINTSSNEAIIITGDHSTDATVEYALGENSTTDSCDLGTGATARSYLPIEQFNLGYVSGIEDGSYRVCRRYSDTAGNVLNVFGGGASELRIIKDTVVPTINLESVVGGYKPSSPDNNGRQIGLADNYRGPCDASQDFDSEIPQFSRILVRNGNACFRAIDNAGNVGYRPTNEINEHPTIAFEGFDSATNELQSGTVTLSDPEGDPLFAGYVDVNAGDACPASSGTISIEETLDGYTQAILIPVAGTIKKSTFEVSGLGGSRTLCVWVTDKTTGVIDSTDVTGIDIDIPTISTLPEYINTPENTPLSDGIINASEKDLTTPLISFPTDSYTDNNPNNITVRYLVTAGDAVCSEQTYPDVSSESIPTPASIADDADSLKVCVRVRDEAGNFAYTEPTGTFSRDTTAPEELTVPTLINQAIPTSGTTPGYINASEVNTSSTEPIITVGTFSDDSTAEYVLALGDQCGTDYLSIDDVHLGYVSGLNDGEYRLCRRYTDTAGNVTEVSDGTLSDGTTPRELKIIKDVVAPVATLETTATSRLIERVYTVAVTSGGNIGDPTTFALIEEATQYDGTVCDATLTYNSITGNEITVAAREESCVRVHDDAGNVSYKATDDGIPDISTDFSGDGVANTTDSILFYAYAIFTANGFSQSNIENLLETVLEKELDYSSSELPRLSDSKEDVYALLDNYAKTNATDFSGDGVTNTTDSILFYAYAIFTANGFSQSNIENLLETVLEKELDYSSSELPRLSDSKEDVYALMHGYSQ